MEIKELKKKDHKKVIQYAIKGMHFNLYLKISFCFMHMANIFGIWNIQMLRKLLQHTREINF